MPGEKYCELIAEARIDGAALMRRCLNAKGNKSGSGGLLWNYSIFPLFGPERVRGGVLPPMSCGNGHEPPPDNLAPAESGTRWRCRQRGGERVAAAGGLRRQVS